MEYFLVERDGAGGLRPAEELPVACVGWTRERTRKSLQEVVTDSQDSMVRRARGYIASIEGAISGQGGHRKTFRVACILRQKFGLTFEEAWPLFQEWNEQCEPPWSDKELAYKLEDAGKQN